MKFLFDQKKLGNYILISAMTTITLLVGFSLGILYSGNQEKEKISLETPPLKNPVPSPTVDEKQPLGLPKEIHKTDPKNLRPISEFDSPHLMHTVYHPRSSGYTKNHTTNLTLYVIYAMDEADPFFENLVTKNSGRNHYGSTVLKTRYSRMGLFFAGEPLSQKKARLLLMSLPVKNYSMDDDIKFR